MIENDSQHPKGLKSAKNVFHIFIIKEWGYVKNGATEKIEMYCRNDTPN